MSTQQTSPRVPHCTSEMLSRLATSRKVRYLHLVDQLMSVEETVERQGDLKDEIAALEKQVKALDGDAESWKNQMRDYLSARNDNEDMTWAAYRAKWYPQSKRKRQPKVQPKRKRS
jgi:aminoglycoside N3'-acetyltransferase